MTINKYVKEWYNEEYDVKFEDFYVENAKWTIEGCWSSLVILKGFVIAFIAFMCWNFRMPLIDALYIFASLSIAQFFYAIREYESNDPCSPIMYIAVLIFCFLTKAHLNIFLTVFVIIIGIALYVYMIFVKPIKSLKQKRNMKRKMEEMEAEEEKADRQSYKQWESAYKSYRYGIPEFEIPNDDPILAEAKKLFEGYMKTKDMLKNRYRQLAKKYHPDCGGDEYMFQAISEVYDELQKQM